MSIITRRILLKSSLAAGIGALAACDVVKLPGSNALGRHFPDAYSNTPPLPTSYDEQSLSTAVSEKLQLSPYGGGHIYEMMMTETEWRKKLTPAAYSVLREGRTEPRFSHGYTVLEDAGVYHCGGCGDALYDSEQKVILDVGWVFFTNAKAATVMLGVDGDNIEAHCRRCGSHLGHILYPPTASVVLHCINGIALRFEPRGA